MELNMANETEIETWFIKGRVGRHVDAVSNHKYDSRTPSKYVWWNMPTKFHST